MGQWATLVRRDPGVFEDVAEWWDQHPVVRRNPFVNSRFLSCWARGYLDDPHQLHVRFLLRRGEPVAALPLYRGHTRLRSLSRDQVSSFDVVASPDAEVTEYLPVWLNQMSMAHLSRLEASSPVVAALPTQSRWVLRRILPSPFIELTGGIEGARSGLSAKSKATLRRKYRRLQGLGEVTFVDHPVDVSGVLENGLRLEAAGWKGRTGEAVLANRARERFYRSLAETAQEEGWLRLSGLYLDDRLIAFEYDLVYGTRRYLMLTTYDESEAIARFSPGSLLLDSVLERSCETGLERFECGYGNVSWKERWASGNEPVYDISVYGRGPLGTLHRALRRGREPGGTGDPGSGLEQVPA